MITPEEIAVRLVYNHASQVWNGTATTAIATALRAYADERLEEAAKACATHHDVPPEYETEPMVWHAAWETCSRAAVAAIRALKSRPPKSEDARDDDIAVTLSCGCVFCDLNLTPKYDGSWFHEGPRRIRVPCNKPLEPTP